MAWVRQLATKWTGCRFVYRTATLQLDRIYDREYFFNPDIIIFTLLFDWLMFISRDETSNINVVFGAAIQKIRWLQGSLISCMIVRCAVDCSMFNANQKKRGRVMMCNSDLKTQLISTANRRLLSFNLPFFVRFLFSDFFFSFFFSPCWI